MTYDFSEILFWGLDLLQINSFLTGVLPCRRYMLLVTEPFFANVYYYDVKRKVEPVYS